jgi:hypothetical protein
VTPDKHGYAQCGRCGTLRPVAHLVTLTNGQGAVVRDECADAAFCSRAAGVGKGEMPKEAGDGQA